MGEPGNLPCTQKGEPPGFIGAPANTGFHTPADCLDWLVKNQPPEEGVYVHGDYCLPNIFIKDGEISGFTDPGSGGASDIFQDIALCVRSFLYNKLPENHLDLFFTEPGIKSDDERIQYYVWLDELF